MLSNRRNTIAAAVAVSAVLGGVASVPAALAAPKERTVSTQRAGLGQTGQQPEDTRGKSGKVKCVKPNAGKAADQTGPNAGKPAEHLDCAGDKAAQQGGTDKGQAAQEKNDNSSKGSKGNCGNGRGIGGHDGAGKGNGNGNTCGKDETPVIVVDPTPAPTAPATAEPTTPAPVATTPAAPTTPAPTAPVVIAKPTPGVVVTVTPAPRDETTRPGSTVEQPRDETTRPGSTVEQPRDETTRPGSTVVPAAPVQRMVKRTFQVDRYMPRTAAQARVVASLDNDGKLRYREDRALWGASRWQFVTVSVPANATKAQVMKAIDAKTSSRVGDVRTTARLASMKAGRSVVVAWELGKGATTTQAWGANKNVAQTFFARS